MSIAIRRAGAGDEALFERVLSGVFDVPIDPSRLAAYLVDSDNLMLLAVAEDGSVAGQCAAVVHRHPDKPAELYLDEVGVAPEFRGQGIATRLMEKMCAVGRSLGCAAAWLCTAPDNAAARALYSRYADAESALIFQWDL